MRCAGNIISVKPTAPAPFWNAMCAEHQKLLWLPCRQNCSINFKENYHAFWKQSLLPMQHNNVLFRLPACGNVSPQQVITTHKIRIYPQTKQVYDLLDLHRRAYNLAIEHFKFTPPDEQENITTLRRKILSQVKSEWESTGRMFKANVLYEAVREAFKTKSHVLSKWVKKQSCDFKFKSIKERKQHFIYQRLNKTFLFTNFYVVESVEDCAYGRMTYFVYENGRWFVCAHKLIETKQGAENQGLALISLDPGVRTFITGYSPKEAIKYGDNFFGDKIFPLLLKMDRLVSSRQKFLNRIKDRGTQFFQDQMRYFSKRLNKLRNKVHDLIDDLHKKVAYDLVMNYDVILIPTFRVKCMVDKKKRKIHTKTVRSMLGLAHYKFKQFLKWMCKKYGKILIEVNEAYTSKTLSWNGQIIENLGGRKFVTDGKIKVDRDINGARNILLRALTAIPAVVAI